MAEAMTHATCAHCGVLVDILDGEAMTIFLGDYSAFVYHGWCFEPALANVVFITRPSTKQEGPYDHDKEDPDKEDPDDAAEGSVVSGGEGVGATEARHREDE